MPRQSALLNQYLKDQVCQRIHHQTKKIKFNTPPIDDSDESSISLPSLPSNENDCNTITISTDNNLEQSMINLESEIINLEEN